MKYAVGCIGCPSCKVAFDIVYNYREEIFYITFGGNSRAFDAAVRTHEPHTSSPEDLARFAKRKDR